MFRAARHSTGAHCEVPVRAAIYARVSTLDQQPENQLAELRRYVAARGWDAAVEYVDHGLRREGIPARARPPREGRRRRKFDVVVTWKLDRLGRNLKHLITLLDDLRALGVAFVSLNEGIDATTPAGTAADARARRDREVRAQPHRRARAGGARAGEGAGDSGSAGSRTTSRRNGSKPSITCRCGTPPRRSASPARSCIGGGCHANPSKSGLETTANSSAISVVAA